MPAETERILSALRCGKAGCLCAKGKVSHCPVHGDAHPSLSITEKDGKLLVHCLTGCSQEAVIGKLKEMKVWPEVGPERRNGHMPAVSTEQPVAEYEYRNAEGDLLAVKGRFEAQGRKTFKWRLPNSQVWDGLHGLLMSDLPLWGADDLVDVPLDSRVFLVEGEKAALACRALGLVATTHPGGASTVDFGDSLEILRNRHVVLWPDNDEAGRRYMARVHAILRGIARTITIVQPPLPEKGDAVEYFGLGGTLDALLRDAPPTTPTVDYLAHDALRVRMASALGVIGITFTSMEKTSRDLNCELEVKLGREGGEPYSQRINLLSGSAVTELRRNLDQVYSKEIGWAQVLNTAIAKARRAFLEQDRAIRLADIQDSGPPAFLIQDLLPLGVPTVWFGTGSSCKTYLALRAGLSVATGQGFAGLAVRKQGGVMMIDYEDTPESFRFRCMRILAGLGKTPDCNPPLLHWPARGIPLVDQIEAVRAKVEKEGITLVIIDSAAAACGGKPEDAETALRYFMCLQKLGDGVTTLTIAHVPKGSDEMRPFGSIFWENQARRTVNFSRTDDEDTDDMDVGVYFRKVNQGRKPKPMAFHVHFTNDVGPVTMERTDLKDVPVLNQKRPVKWQAWDTLAQPLTVADIADRLGNTEPAFIKSLTSILGQEKGMFTRVEASAGGRGVQTKWGRVLKQENADVLPF